MELRDSSLNQHSNYFTIHINEPRATILVNSYLYEMMILATPITKENMAYQWTHGFAKEKYCWCDSTICFHSYTLLWQRLYLFIKPSMIFVTLIITFYPTVTWAEHFVGNAILVHITSNPHVPQ